MLYETNIESVRLELPADRTKNTVIKRISTLLTIRETKE
jgi:hypothetical protein